MGTALARFLGLAALWIVLIRSAQPADLAVGALTAAAATWASLRLLPPDAGRVKFAALAARAPRFLWQSVVAGIDVARRAFARACRSAPGSSLYPAGLPRGAARNAFATITSLLPGSVPADDDESGDPIPLPGYRAAGRGAARDRGARLRRGARAGEGPWLSSCSPRPASSC